MQWQIVRNCLLTLALATTATSCVFSNLENDLEKLDDAFSRFSGSVSTNEIEANSIIILALHDRQGDNIAGFRVLTSPGPFEMRLDAQPTYFLAFDDVNRDLKYQVSEPYGWAANSQSLSPSGEEADSVNITISPSSDGQHPVPDKLTDRSLEFNMARSLQFNFGTVSSLDNPWFGEEMAKKGLWEPFAFMEEGGTGIHFLEPYDPDRIPVLFVHGISGSPQNFSSLIAQLDKSRFQPWVFSYPSGLRLGWLSYGLYEFLEVLHIRLHFDELHMVSHSMGGLVSRSTVNQCAVNNSCRYLRSYTTISTPWSGVSSARSGVEWAPTVVPVWRDMDPASDYVLALFDTPLPGGLPFHLIFGFRQDSIFGSDSSDGTIKLNSQLRSEAQLQSSTMRGYDEGHVSILSSKFVAGQLNQIFFESE